MTSIQVRVPEAVWKSVLDVFAEHEPGVERIAYLDGFRVDETGYPDVLPDAEVCVAATVVIPEGVLRPQNYVVPADAVSAAGHHLRAERMLRVAQVHSHGNDWVEHSRTDDERAYSQRPGAVSVVIPFHGTTRPDPTSCGVHIRTATGWRRVQPESVIKMIPSVIDHRSPPSESTPIPAQHGGTYFRFLAWLRTVLRRPDRSE